MTHPAGKHLTAWQKLWMPAATKAVNLLARLLDHLARKP